MTPEFEIQAVNNLDRYVSILVGSSTHEYGINEFILGPKSSRYNSATKYIDTQLLLDGQQSINHLYSYGPGTKLSSFYVYGDVVDESRVKEAYRKAAMLTLVDLHVIPYLSDGAEGEACLRNKWIKSDPKGFPYLELPFSGISIVYPQLESQDYWHAARNIISIISADAQNFVNNTINSGRASGSTPDVIVCSTLSTGNLLDSVLDTLNKLLATQNALLAKILGAVDSILSNDQTLRKLAEFNPKLQKALNEANPQERWDISNLHAKDESNISAIPTEGFNAATPGEMAKNINDDVIFQYEFDGECPVDTYCDWYVFNRERPNLDYNFTFKAESCDNDATSNNCRNILLNNDQLEDFGGTKEAPTTPLSASPINLTFPYDANRKQYTGTFSVADLDGAYADYPYVLQIEEAQPEIEVYVDGVLLDKSDPVIELTCSEEGSSESKSITVKNIGLGKLYLEQSNEIFRGEWSLNEPFEGEFEALEISMGQSVTRTLTNSCSSTPAYLPGYVTLEDEYDNYNERASIRLQLEVIPPVDCVALEEQVLGAWSVGNNNLVLAEGGQGRYIGELADNLGNCPGPGVQPIEKHRDNGYCNYPVSWRIDKINGACFLREFGFYHFGYEEYRVFDPSLEDSTISDPVGSFKTYFSYDDGPGVSRIYSR